MPSLELSGTLLQPITLRVEEWLAEGKLDENDLEAALGADARALVDHGLALRDWAPLEVGESLVAVVGGQLGGETGLVEWAREIVADWREREPMDDLIARARSLVDAPGFVVTAASERLVRRLAWRYEGGRDGFRVRLLGVGGASAELKAWLGALLARLAELASERASDVRFMGVDAAELVVYGDLAPAPRLDARGDRRLRRAALAAGGEQPSVRPGA